MSVGELVFSDGSSLRGSYRITQIKTGVKLLTFVTSDFSTDAFKKEADFLRTVKGDIIAKGLKKTDVGVKNNIMTIFCQFLEKG
jgi:hypothetical protein